MNDLKKSRNPKNYITFLLFMSLFVASSSQAKNLGVWGALFPIVEQDIKEFIYARLNEMEQNGEIEKLKNKFIQNVKNHSVRPAPVAGLTTTDKPRIFYYDPTYILNKTIEDDKGNVIAKAGTRINPLDTIKLHGVMFFLDTDDKRQIKWAFDNAKKYEYARYVLVRGNIKEAGEVLNDRIYFDQYGLITHKLGIRHIPCVVVQNGKRLQIREYALSALNEEAKERKLKNNKNNIDKKDKRKI